MKSNEKEKKAVTTSTAGRVVGSVLGAAIAICPTPPANAAEPTSRPSVQTPAQDADAAFIHPGLAAMIRRATTPGMTAPGDPWYQWTVRF